MASVADAEDFITYINKLYQWALDYGGGTAAANVHVMQWLRHREYGSFAWRQLLGEMDEKFLDAADSAGIPVIDYYDDPIAPVQVKISHLFATMNGVYVKGPPAQPPDDGGLTMPPINASDVAGWGGDWFTFYGDWQNAIATFPDGEAYCNANLASPTIETTFKLRDMIEDVTGFNVAMAMRNDSTLGLPDAIAQHLQPTGASGYRTRFRDFYAGRFNSDTVFTVNTAVSMLLSVDDLLIAAGRTLKIFETAGFFADFPAEIPVSKIRLFCLGLDDVLQDLIKEEKSAPPP